MSTLLSERGQLITAPKLRDRAPAQRSSLRTSARHEPAAAVSGHPLVAPRASWSGILGLVVATLHVWLSRRVARRELGSLDERMLRDIGLDAGTVDYEVRQWFWRPDRNWRD
jgi:uncharacterized protein YjiS (DUF1127 family)